MPRPKANRRKNGPRSPERDSLDFRDWIYQPALVGLPEFLLPRKSSITVLDQGEEGACTGFGLAALINFLLRMRDGDANERVSPRMLYEMAKRHDRWPGTRYDGSTARGAMKGWFKNGVCLEGYWPYEVDDPGELTPEARENAARYPLGAFYRVLPRRSDLHAALVEAGAVYATAATHKGWDATEDGLIPYEPGWREQGGHAFAIIGFTHEGFLIQNSWGEDWGGVTFDRTTYPGCAIWKYRDFDRNLWDAWVARLARPFESIEALKESSRRRGAAVEGTRPAVAAPPRAAIRGHFVHIDDGAFDPHGDYYSGRRESEVIVREAVRSGADQILLYAHGGLNSVKSSAIRVDRWHPVFQANKVYEIHFIWETGLLEELRDVLLGKQEFVERRAGGLSDWTDRWIERVSGSLGRGLWREMLSDAELAFAEGRAGELVLRSLVEELRAVSGAVRPKVHLVGHSAGAVLLGHLLACWERLLDGSDDGLAFENLILYAPACTHAFFESHIRPALASRRVGGLHHFLLDDRSERNDNVARIYRKSILYLVSRSYQKKGEVVPIMGMKKHLAALPIAGVGSRVHCYTHSDHPDRTTTTSHTGFDNDPATMNTMLRLVLGRAPKRLFEQEELSGY